MRQLLNYFFKGLLIVVPVFLTVYILVLSIHWLDGLIELSIPGLGLLIILAVTTFLGYLANLFFIEPFFKVLENLVEKIPLVNIIYASLRDLISAFVGEKRRFDKAVLVTFDGASHLMKPGFITSDDLKSIGLPGMVSVYFPHSYNFSGNIFIVDKKYIQPIYSPSAEVMRYIVSGGVSGSINLMQDEPLKTD